MAVPQGDQNCTENASHGAHQDAPMRQIDEVSSDIVQFHIRIHRNGDCYDEIQGYQPAVGQIVAAFGTRLPLEWNGMRSQCQVANRPLNFRLTWERTNASGGSWSKPHWLLRNSFLYARMKLGISMSLIPFNSMLNSFFVVFVLSLLSRSYCCILWEGEVV